MRLTQGLAWSARVRPAGVSTIDGDTVRTWADTADRVARLATVIAAAGHGKRVAILALNRDHYLEMLFAIAWAGCVCVPLNTRWSRREVLDALRDSDAGLILLGPEFADLVDAAGTLGVERLVWSDGPAGLEARLAAAAPMADHSGRGDDLAGIFFTGGTTGRNKGVMLSHANLVSAALMMQARAPYPTDTCLLHVPPLFHLAAVSSMLNVTMVGGRQVFLPAFAPADALRLIEQHQVSAVLLVPTLIAMLCDAMRTVAADVSSVRRISYGASAISPALLATAMRLFPHAEFVQGYGQTELAPALTLLDGDDHRAGRLASAGRPLPLTDVRIVDEVMRTLPSGAVGEVAARGPNVMLGYLNMPELTAETIVDGWLRTGDAGYMDADGYLYLVDRVKDMIVSGGENIFSAEIENVLMEHPAVLQCAAIGVPDAVWGERVHAVVQQRGGTDLTAGDLDAHCRERLAGYKRPRSFDVRTEALPMSGVGKVLKTELRRPYWADAGREIA